MLTPNPVDLFLPEIRALLRDKRLEELKALVSELNPIDLADAFTEFSGEEKLVLFRLLVPKTALIVFEELESIDQQFLLHHLGDAALAPILEGVPTPVLAKCIQRLPAPILRRMESLVAKSHWDTINKTTVYPPGTAGAAMTGEAIILPAQLTAQQAIDDLRSRLRVRDESAIFAVYVVNDDRKVIGHITLRRLVAAPRDVLLKDLMMPVGLVSIAANLPAEEASKIFARYKLLSAPVLDEEGRLAGVLLAGTMLSIEQQASTEDIQKLGAVDALDEPYFRISFFKMVKKRGGWLCVLFIGEMLTATAMGFFEKEISRAVVLALFIPLVISSGGNSGSQAATLIVRAMALREVGLADWWRVMRREFQAGLALGAMLGTLGFLRIYIWSQFSPIYGAHYLQVASTVGLALVFIVMWGSLTGSLLPLILRKIGLDPAVVSAPFVATLVDVTGLIIYFSTAMLILRGTLL